MADSSDWYQFTTNGTATIAAAVSIAFLHAQGDLDLEVSTRPARWSAAAGHNEQRRRFAFWPGGSTYYLQVYGYRGVFNPNYSLSINAPASTPTTPTTTNPTSPVTAFPEVPYYGTQHRLGAQLDQRCRSPGAGLSRAAGVVVAVVDTGVDLDHSDLASNIWINPGEIAGNGIDDDHDGYVDDIHGWDFARVTTIPMTGTVTARTWRALSRRRQRRRIDRRRPDATIMPVRVLGSDGSGSRPSVAAGIRYPRDSADIINLSLGGGIAR